MIQDIKPWVFREKRVWTITKSHSKNKIEVLSTECFFRGWNLPTGAFLKETDLPDFAKESFIGARS